MTRTDQTMAQLIDEELATRGVSQAEFCRQVGVSPKHLCGVLSGKVSARPAALDYWAFALNMRVRSDVGGSAVSDHKGGTVNEQEVRRRADEWMREQLSDTAERLDASAEQADALGWGTTGVTLRQAASSIRWQLRWDETHPKRREREP